jgi:putative glutamine amidotransferase
MINYRNMRNSGKLLLTLVLVFFLKVSFAQDFLNSELNKNKTYVLLAHPTVGNIETINFLLNHNILKVPDVEFVGVYSSAENYNYNQSVSLIKRSDMSRFHLQKIDGNESPAHIYMNNEWTKIFKSLFDHSVGIFFFGGPDIQPELYGQNNLYSVVTDPNRHLFELSFLFHLIGGNQNEAFIPFLKEKPGYFVSGFCLGLQSMNVAAGGTLYQDIPAQIYKKTSPEEIIKLRRDQMHRNNWKETSKDSLLMEVNFHPIKFTAQSFFARRVKSGKKSTPLVLSSHHQSIDKIGKDLLVTATSIDELVIEGIQHLIYPNVFAVQFHPEFQALYSAQQKLKFTPADTPKSFFEILSLQDRKFHLKYWKTISKAIKSSAREQESSQK